MQLAMDPKQITHIVAEIAIIAGVIIYVNQKNKKLEIKINELTTKLQETEKILQTHEQIIPKILNDIQNLYKTQILTQSHPNQSHPNQSVQLQKTQYQDISPNSKNSEKFEFINQFSEEEDLDNELKEELRDLLEPEPESLSPKNIVITIEQNKKEILKNEQIIEDITENEQNIEEIIENEQHIEEIIENEQNIEEIDTSDLKKKH